MIGASGKTVTRYAKLAKVTIPQRGRRNYLYPRYDVRKILETIIEKASDREMIARCRAALKRL
jgi:hypothetical protein